MPDKFDKNAQIFFPKYAVFIVFYAMIFVTIGVFFAKILDTIFPKFDEQNPKHKMVLYVEVLLQICAIALVTYIFREYVNYCIMYIDFFRKHNYGSPDKFATTIIAPTMFALQPSLIQKIKYIASF